MKFFVSLGCLLVLLAGPCLQKAVACSMCKVTRGGRTYLGSNEDSWRTGARIWFEEKTPEKFGCAYVGYEDLLPQGGMNEAGLAFDALSTLPKPLRTDSGKKELTSLSGFLKTLLQRCQTVEEVYAFALPYNRQKLCNHGVLLFADKNGHQLVMESDTMLLSNDAQYVIANFCPSITPQSQRMTFGRYKRGAQFLQNHPTDAQPDFAYRLLDTMHECRPRLGDGTVYSFVADLNGGTLTLAFYHDFSQPHTFDLQDELAKGTHVIPMETLFPPNAEYERLKHFHTPQNTPALLGFVLLSVGFFAFAALYFALRVVRGKRLAFHTRSDHRWSSGLAFLNAAMAYYAAALLVHEEIFYFPAPYKGLSFSALTLAAYLPFVLLLILGPLGWKNVQVLRQASWKPFAKSVFTLNTLLYAGFTVLFFYWGLYNVR